MSESKTSKSRVNCCVYNCHAIKKKNPNFSFHTFPTLAKPMIKLKTKLGTYELVSRRYAWIKNCYSAKEITNNMKICSRHFHENDFFPGRTHRRVCLKNTAIPTVDMPKPPYYLSPNVSHSIEEKPRIYDQVDVGTIYLKDMNTSHLITGKVKRNMTSPMITLSDNCANFGLFVAHELSSIKSSRLRTKLKGLIKAAISEQS